MSKLNLTDSVEKIITKMSDGNPGAMNVLIIASQINPFGLFEIVLPLDELELYGSDIYQLWNDCCKRDISRVKEVLKLWQEGKISKEEIHNHVKQPWGISFDSYFNS